ncbi:MAG: sulfotransferase family 2 domain-containing protein [Gammaproteobacteria bacterium]
MDKKTYYAFTHNLCRLVFSAVHRRKFQILQNRRKAVSDAGYTYKPFDENKCIFVHIPKTAGVSVSKSLFGNFGGGHDPISVYRHAFSKEEFYGYFKFTFVRNPWDRLLSAYNYLMRGGMNAGDRLWAEKNIFVFENFEEFVKKGLDNKGILSSAHFKPQYRFICPPFSTTILVDFVGRYENLGEDFNYIKSRLPNKSAGELPLYNAGASKLSDYRDCYTEETRTIAGNIYCRDIELFEYDFDEGSGKVIAGV